MTLRFLSCCTRFFRTVVRRHVMSCESYSRLTSRNRYDPKNDMSSTATGSAQSANSSRLLAFRNGLQTTINNRHRCCHLPNNAENVIITRYRPGSGETIRLSAEWRRWQLDPKIAADLRPSADASAVRASPLAGGG